MLDEADRQEAPEDEASSGSDKGSSSVMDDVMSLVDDGMTYAEAEVAYQKTRLAFAGNRAKKIAILVGLSSVMVVFALFALVFGAILALTPLFTAMGATAIVVTTLLVVALLLGIFAKARTRELVDAFTAEKE